MSNSVDSDELAYYKPSDLDLRCLQKPFIIACGSEIDKHYENTPIQIYRKFHLQKNWKFSDKKNSDIFHISAQNIDCGYSLEPPRLAEAVLTSIHNLFWAEIRKIMYTPLNPSFTI